MVKFKLIFFVFCAIQHCVHSRITWSYELPSKDDGSQNKAIEPKIQHRLKKIGLSEAQYRKLSRMHLTIEGMEQLKNSIGYSRTPVYNEDNDYPNILCTLMSPDYVKADENYTTIQHSKQIDEFQYTMREPESRYLLWRNITCPYVSNPEPYERFAKSLGLRMYSYFNFEFIKKSYNATTDSSRVLKARLLCRVFLTQDNFACVTLNNNTDELNDRDMEQFKELWNQAETANETSREAAYRLICKELNLSQGLPTRNISENAGGKTNMYFLERFWRPTYRWYMVSPKKIVTLKTACTSINESLSIGEIGQQIGLTSEEYKNFSEHNYHFQPVDREQQAALLCSMLKANAADFPYSPRIIEYMGNFAYDSIKILQQPIAERAELMKKNCEKNFGAFVYDNATYVNNDDYESIDINE